MGKMSQYLFILSGLVLLINIFGLTNGGTLLGILMHPSTIQGSALFSKLFIAIAAMAVLTTVTAGFIMPYKSDLPVAAIFVGVLALLFEEMVGIFIAVNNSFNSALPGGLVSSGFNPLALLLISPFIVLFGLTLFEFWRGRD